VRGEKPMSILHLPLTLFSDFRGFPLKSKTDLSHKGRGVNVCYIAIYTFYFLSELLPKQVLNLQKLMYL